jgi:transketolase
MNLNVAIVGVGAGFSYSESGATHHSVEDIGLMRLLPRIRTFSASDNAQVRFFVREIMRNGGPFYVRLDRHSLPDLYPSAQPFGRSLALLRPSAGVNFLATGIMTHEALDMATTLEKEGLRAGVADVFSFPFDEEEFTAALHGSNLLVSLEEHVAAGGLGEAARMMLDKCGLSARLRSWSLNMREGLCHSYGSRSILQERHGIAQKHILEEIRRMYA